MSWYNPISWFFDPDPNDTIASSQQAAYDYVIRRRADAENGIITWDEYYARLKIYEDNYGPLPASSQEAYNQGAARVSDILDQTTLNVLQEAANDLNPKNAIPKFWDSIPTGIKLAALAAIALLAIHLLTKAGILGKKKT